jgi:hypothetical protein
VFPANRVEDPGLRVGDTASSSGFKARGSDRCPTAAAVADRTESRACFGMSPHIVREVKSLPPMLFER